MNLLTPLTLLVLSIVVVLNTQTIAKLRVEVWRLRRAVRALPGGKDEQEIAELTERLRTQRQRLASAESPADAPKP